MASLRRLSGCVAGALVLMSVGTGAHAQSLDERVGRLEQLVNSRSLVEMALQVSQLREEVSDLRGQLETQGHRLEELQRKQRELYLDLDRRLSRLEARPAPAPVPAGEGEAPGDGAPMPEGTTPGPGAAAPDAQPAVEGVAPTAGADAQAAYDRVLTVLQEGRYDQAEQAFRQFLERYPQSPLAANAQYWIGETFYVRQRMDEALTAFRRVVDAYPNSPKAADALLKIGYIHTERGDAQQARQVLTDVRNRYAGTRAAALAKERLGRLPE